MSGQRVSTENDEEELLLENLPIDVLLRIFGYCDDVSLGRLSRLCRRFNEIISDDFLWSERSRKVIVTNQLSKEVLARSFCVLLSREKCRISMNWKKKCSKEEVYFAYKTRYMPWLSLSNNILWLSKGKDILSFKRKRDGILANSPLHTFKGHSEDVCRFVIAGDTIISGGRDTAICGWNSETGQLLLYQENSHTSDISAVAVYNETIVSGSRDRTVKLWRWTSAEYRFEFLRTIDVEDRVWSVSICPQGSKCAVGSAGHHVLPLLLYDMEQGVEVMELKENYKPGAGMLDMHWETPHLLLSAGYDAYIRLWDIRTGSNVKSWEDPYDTPIYCLGSDNMYTILSGTAQHGRVQLWDKRHRSSIQTYFMKAIQSSPVYSLAFDPRQLFVALDQSINIMDFSGFKNVAANCA